MPGAGSARAPDAEIRGILVAVAALGGDTSAFAALDDGRRQACVAAWREVGGMGDWSGSRQLALWREEALAAIPTALSRLHPSWCEESLAGEHREIVAAIAAGQPTARLLARLAFGHLLPLCESSQGAIGERLCRLGFESLLGEITRRGAQLIGRTLASAPVSLRARTMAAVGEPWAAEISAFASEPPSDSERAAAVAAVSAADATDGRSARERLLYVGLAGLKAELGAEGQGSLLSIAGRLPAALGRSLLGW